MLLTAQDTFVSWWIEFFREGIVSRPIEPPKTLEQAIFLTHCPKHRAAGVVIVHVCFEMDE